MLQLRSGNRDEEVFPDPDVFDTKRKRGVQKLWRMAGEGVDAKLKGLLEPGWRLSLVFF